MYGSDQNRLSKEIIKTILHRPDIPAHPAMESSCDCGSHSQEVLSQWHSFVQRTTSQSQETAVDGHSLDIATVVAVAR